MPFSLFSIPSLVQGYKRVLEIYFWEGVEASEGSHLVRCEVVSRVTSN